MIETPVLERVLGRPSATAATLPRCSRKTGPPRRPSSTTAGSRSCRRDGSGGPASGWSSGRPPASPTPPTSARPACSEAAEAASAVARRGGGGTTSVAAADPWSDRDPADGTDRDPAVSKADTSTCLRQADEAARASGGAISQVQAGYGGVQAAGADRQLRRAAGRGRAGPHPLLACPAWPKATPACRPARVDRPHRRLRTLRRSVGRGAGPAGGPPGAVQAVGPPRALAARYRWSWPAGAAASSSTRPAVTGSRPTTSPRTPRCTWARSASRWPARWSPWSTTARWVRVGNLRLRRRRPARPSATCSSRTACSPSTCGTTCGPARRAGCRRATGAARATSTCPWSG